MMNLKQILARPLQVVPSKVVAAFLVIALIGFADAAYLTIEHYQNRIPPCSVGGCETVLTSAYSTVAGIPVSLIGAISYILIAAGALAYLEGRREKPFRFALALSAVNFLASIYFFILQAFVIHAYCYYCLGSAATSTILFVMACSIFKKYNSGDMLVYSHE